MLRSFGILLAGWLSVISTLVLAASPLQIHHAWVPQAPPVARVMAGYLEIRNPSAQDITLTSASSAVFGAVEIHETRVEEGMARMIQQTQLVIPAGKTVKFERGGLHLMLMQPKQAFQPGDKINIEFTTDDQQRIAFEALVKPATLDENEHHHHHH